MQHSPPRPLDPPQPLTHAHKSQLAHTSTARQVRRPTPICRVRAAHTQTTGAHRHSSTAHHAPRGLGHRAPMGPMGLPSPERRGRVSVEVVGGTISIYKQKTNCCFNTVAQQAELLVVVLQHADSTLKTKTKKDKGDSRPAAPEPSRTPAQGGIAHLDPISIPLGSSRGSISAENEGSLLKVETARLGHCRWRCRLRRSRGRRHGRRRSLGRGRGLSCLPRRWRFAGNDAGHLVAAHRGQRSGLDISLTRLKGHAVCNATFACLRELLLNGIGPGGGSRRSAAHSKCRRSVAQRVGALGRSLSFAEVAVTD